jgi:hypothetical protein
MRGGQPGEACVALDERAEVSGSLVDRVEHRPELLQMRGVLQHDARRVDQRADGRERVVELVAQEPDETLVAGRLAARQLPREAIEEK